MSLILYVGPMFAGKSTELIREAGRYHSIGNKVLIINHKLDTRYGEEIVGTHSGLSVDAVSLDVLPEEELNYDVIIVDEGQFFKGLVSFCLFHVERFGKVVIVGALDSDANREKFGEIQDLSRYADTVFKLKAFCAICRDRTPAIFSSKKKNETKTDSSQIEVGAAKYVAVCRKHYIELNPL